MSSLEVENVSKYLRTKEIQLPSNNKWLLDCINWYKSHTELRTIYHSVQDYVCIQWLLSDLRDVQNSCLPTNSKNGVMDLTGKYCVQVNWVRDISQPCYTQMQALKNSNITDSNDNVTAEETKKQNWEPSPKRVLMMEITDGFTTLKATEHSPIPKLTEPFIPGFKVVLTGPIECRKGILLLKNNNISLLGGEVDFMADIYSKEKILSRCLNIIPPVTNNGSGEHGTNVITPLRAPSPPRANERPPPPLFNDMDQLPDSTSFLENNPVEDNHDAMMADDDDLLCQLPDTMFDDAGNYDPPQDYPQSSPVLDEELPQVQSSTLINKAPVEIVERPILYNRPVNSNRPKLFPSMEDLTAESKSSVNTKQLTLASIHARNVNQPETSSSNRNPSVSLTTSKPAVSVTSHKDVYRSDILMNKNTSCEITVKDEPNLQNLDDSISNHIDNVLDASREENIYPQFKRVKVKVLSITKLKIRKNEWNCCATVSIEDKTENVTFCNKLLEKLFGTSATEVEVLRSEMAKNQSLKEKINGILKMGQAKLKHLNGLMIVEYTSEDCTPNIVSLHEE